MKTMKHSGKKILSVFLAVLMVMTAWVFVAPTESEAVSAVTISAANANALDSIGPFNTDVATIHGSFESDSDYLDAQYYDGIYKNVLYTDGPVTIDASASSAKTQYGSSITGSNGVTIYWYHPTATVMYDGETTPSLGIAVNTVMYYTGTWSRKTVNRLSYISSGGNGFTFNTNWKGSDGRLNFNWMWYGQSELMGYTSTIVNDSMRQTLKGNSDNHFYGNLLKFTASMSDNEFYRSAQPTFGFYGDNGSNGKTITATTSDTLYVINYKPLKAALNEALGTGTYSISTLKSNTAKYTTDSIAEYVAAVKDLIAAKPNNYVNSSKNDYVGYANAASAAVTRFNNAKANLEIQQYTLTFKDINGNVKSSNKYNYGTALDCASIAAGLGNTIKQIDKDNHQSYSWNTATYVTTVTDDVVITETANNAENHTYGGWTQNEADHTRTCSVCGYVQTQEHKKGTGYETKAETCTEDGVMTYDCSVCGKKAIATSAINTITGHNFTGTAVENVEGENGNHWRKCSRCNVCGWGTAANAYENHNWDKNSDGIVDASDAIETKASTCKEAGYEKYKCTVCSATWTKTLDLATHTIAATAAKDVTNVCGGDGNAAFWSCSVCDRVWKDEALTDELADTTDADGDNIPDALETKGPDHNFTGAYKSASSGENGKHYRQCSRFTQCGKYGLMVDGKAVVGATEAHKFTSTETASSCTVQGTKTYTCSDCNHSYTEKLPLVAHTMETIAAVAATCTTGGNNKYYKCTACSQYFKDENGTTKTTVEAEKIAELKHTFIVGNDIADPTKDRLDTAATCLAPAVYVTTCDRCGVESPDSRYSYGDPIAHVYDGTKKSNGDGTHSYACTNDCNCGTYGVGSIKDATENCVYSNYSKIDATKHKVSCACGDYKEEGHSYGSWIADTTSVGTEKGTMTRTCPLCGQTETTECSYTEIGRINATCDDPGSVTYKCTDANCGHTYTETLPALGHEWVENNETYRQSAATCEANAVYYKYCTKCQKSSQAYTGETWTKKGSKLTHDWNEWVQSVDENGVATHTRTCKHASSASCTETGTCSGGTATCMNRAVCSTCNAEYGDINEENHVNKDFVAKVPSTCQTEGTEAYYKCADCGDALEKIVKIEKLDHKYGAWSQIAGEDKHTRSCTTCDATVAAVAKETAGCSGGEATCIARAKCEVCKAEYGEKNSANHATQAATLKDAKEASCTEEGYTGDRHYDCCNAIKEKGTAIPMLDHKYTVALEETKVASTCTEKGSIDYKCETCDAKENRELELNPQNHSSEETIVVNDKAATCESDGYTGDTYHKCCYKPGGSTAENRYALISKGTVIKANGQHVYSPAVPEYMIDEIVEEKDAEGNVTSRSIKLKTEEPDYAKKITYRRADNYWYHKQICTICYEVVETRCYTYPDHQADCVNTDSCFVCKGLCSLTNPDKHTLKEIEKISATCEKNGRKAYYVCEACGKEFFDLAGKNEITDENKSQLVIPSTMKHTIDRDKTPIADNKGNHTYSCSVCGTAIVEACSGGEATCKNKAKCEYCGEEYGELNENKHVKGIIQGNVAPDRCKPGVSGKTVYECCPDVVVYEGDIIPATEPHDWKETTDKADNCANGYTITKTCNYCGEVETTEVAAGTHDLSVVVYETEKDCKKERTIYYACSICGFTDKEVEIDGVTYKYIFAEVIEAKEDCTWTSWTYEQKPSCVVEGKKTRKCVACGKTEEEILPKTDHTIKTEAGYAATCDKAGKQDYVYCVIEGCPYAKGGAPIGQLAGYEKYKDCNGKVIEALGHGDHNGDDYCDHCGGFLHENEDGTNCNCICHKRHWFMRIIYKILRFFWKLFGISRTCCSAGVHY